MQDPVRTQPITDRQIVELLRRRDEDGVRTLLDLHGGAVRRTLLRRFGSQHLQDIEDAISVATFRVWDRIGEFDEERRLGGWFFSIAWHALITSLRTHAVTRLMAILDTDALDRLASAAPVASAAGRSQVLEALRDCMDRLSPMQRDIILSDLHGQSEGPELAQRWQTSPNSIYVSRNKAHKRLRRCLERKGYGR